jgi:hypothetical protein
MKKRSLFIVVAMVLLLAVVLGMGGTTFAKYITTAKDDSNTATVAKWGYSVSVNAQNLFSDAYKGDVAVENTVDGLEVDAAATAVAPGTKGSFAIDVTGTAEVLSKITFAFTAGSDVVLKEDDCAGFVDALDEDYYPVKWTVTDNKGTPADPSDDAVVQAATNLAGLKAFFDGKTAANSALGPNTPTNIHWTISWEWAFTGQNDEADTRLGDIVADSTLKTNDDTSTVIDFDLIVTVEQIEG